MHCGWLCLGTDPGDRCMSLDVLKISQHGLRSTRWPFQGSIIVMTSHGVIMDKHIAYIMYRNVSPATSFIT